MAEGAFLGGEARIELPAPIGTPFKIRLISASQIVGAFSKITVSAPRDSNCWKYAVEPVTPVYTFYTVAVTPRRSQCPGIDHPFLWFGVAFGSLCLCALAIFLSVWYFKCHGGLTVKK